jgi:hypothetical protein
VQFTQGLPQTFSSVFRAVFFIGQTAHFNLECMVPLRRVEDDGRIILIYYFYFLWLCNPARTMASSFMRFRDHTQRRATVSRTPLDEWANINIHLKHIWVKGVKLIHLLRRGTIGGL